MKPRIRVFQEDGLYSFFLVTKDYLQPICLHFGNQRLGMFK